jgi:MFS family permease
LTQVPDPLVASEEVAARGPASVLEFGPPRAPALLRGFRALRHRDFRIFYTGQLVSLIGTWMQSLAQSWLVLVLTSSALALGLVSALQFLPVLLLSAFGGAIADRQPKRWVLVGTQIGQMILAFILAVLTAEQMVTYVDVAILALLLGIASAVDMPTRQAFVAELVAPRDLTNAIALNSTLFNAARLIGPALAGFLIGSIGIAGCFFLNGLSFLPVIVGLLLIHPSPRPTTGRATFAGIWDDLHEGLRYVRRAKTVFSLIVLIGALSTFGFNFNVVLPILAYRELMIGATGLGWLMAAMGLGSLLASLRLAYLRGHPDLRMIVGAAVVFSLLEIALSTATSYALALVLLVLIGATMVIVSALGNTYIQLEVPHRLRGRVMSIYTTVFVGSTPIGNALSGAVAETAGAFGPLMLGGLASLSASIVVGRRIWKAPPKLAIRRHERD